MTKTQMFGALTLAWMLALTYSVALGLENMGFLSLMMFIGFAAVTAHSADSDDAKSE